MTDSQRRLDFFHQNILETLAEHRCDTAPQHLLAWGPKAATDLFLARTAANTADLTAFDATLMAANAAFADAAAFLAAAALAYDRQHLHAGAAFADAPRDHTEAQALAFIKRHAAARRRTLFLLVPRLGDVLRNFPHERSGWTLRYVLSNAFHILMLGATDALDPFTTYSEPFYEYFRRFDLNPS